MLSTSSRRKLTKTIGVLFLSIYCLLLVIGAPTRAKGMYLLDELQIQVDSFFKTIRLDPGRHVFPGHRQNFKPRRSCLSFIGEKQGGERKILYQTRTWCEMPAVITTESRLDIYLAVNLDIMVQHIAIFDWSEYVRSLRKKRRISQASRFFCNSKIFNNEGVQKVYTTWLYEFVTYRGQQTHSHYATIPAFDCEKDKAIESWPSLEFESLGISKRAPEFEFPNA